MAGNEDDREMLQDILYNSKLSEGYLALARDLEVMEAKSPMDIYKKSEATIFNCQKHCLSSYFEDWLFKHEEHGRTNAVACLGMISLWDVDSGLAQLRKCFPMKDVYGMK
ncbi:26S proteasome non-ATPase regulatory subunit 2 homolog A-like [Vicia villosa]|uniref:26S proteasome non-ATPase regulatory subunit 2 homolog A-like n=1 Tax=Vicia villosa TaxID=3911 RepID=UPI00273BAFEA|nr:26S proteasome non-ATPase regulatory subunit 2 homolog A-like [Vicia villosa]